MNNRLLFNFLSRVRQSLVSSTHLSEDDLILRNYCDSKGFIRLEDSPSGPRYCLTESGESEWLSMSNEIEQSSQKEAQERAEKNAEKRESERLRVKDARRSWWQFFLGLFIGWLLGGFTPKEVFDWIRSLF